MLLTLDYIHQRGIIHRDIKPDNILINKISEGEYDIKIADFGLAAILAQNTSTNLLFTKCGTPGYAAPEMLRSQGYSYKSDIFSLGCVFFNILTNKELFNGRDNDHLLKLNKKCDLAHLLHHLDLTSLISKDAHELLL